MKIVYCLSLISLSVILTYYIIQYHQVGIFEGNIKIINNSCKQIKSEKCYGIKKCLEILKNSWNTTNSDFIILEVDNCGYFPRNYGNHIGDVILVPFNYQKCRGSNKLLYCNNYDLCYKKICAHQEKIFVVQATDNS